MGWKDKEMEANGEWKIKQSEFNGYAKSQFDSIHETLHEIKEVLKKQDIECGENANNISLMKGQITVYAVVIAIVVSAIVSIFTGMI